MTENSSPPTIQTVSLVRRADNAPAFPVLGRVGDRFGRALKDALAGFGCAEARIAAPQTSINTFADLRDGETVNGAVCRFRMTPMKGVAVILFPKAFVRQLVDGFYGGSGDATGFDGPLSTGETRFVTRLAERCGALLADAWADVVAVVPDLTQVASDWGDVDFVRASDLVVAQRFGIGGGTLADCAVTLLYPADSLRTLSKRGEAESAPEAEPVDAEWRDRLTSAVLQTRLPLRTIFARPELPVHKLLTLKPGDVFPLTLPARVPVTVAGRAFAEATVGEANGRVAIQIETMKGTSNE